MESDRNPFPEIHLLQPIETIKEIGSRILSWTVYGVDCVTEAMQQAREAAEDKNVTIIDWLGS